MLKNRDRIVDYTIQNFNMPFEVYIQHCQSSIRKAHHSKDGALLEKIVMANSPFEFKPSPNNAAPEIGLLLIHGLLDSPFTMRDLATRFAENGMLCKSVLLKGHGTTPDDLIHSRYQDWLDVINYGVQSLSKTAKHIFLVGYSTGAVLALYHALHNHNIAGIIMLAPAIKIKFPIDPLIHLSPYFHFKKNQPLWLKKENEIDYTKYRSIPYHAVNQVSELSKHIPTNAQPDCPLFITVSHNDETISTQAATNFFQHNTHDDSMLLIYTPSPRAREDTRILERNSSFPDQEINHFSHRCLPFAPSNFHYGKRGDYSRASHPDALTQYGAYIGLLGMSYQLLHALHITKENRRELTYNPDFDFLSSELIKFIRTVVNKK